MRRALRGATTTLEKELGREPGFEELAAALRKGFATRLNRETQSVLPM